jgi:hypothetical protein
MVRLIERGLGVHVALGERLLAFQFARGELRRFARLRDRGEFFAITAAQGREIEPRRLELRLRLRERDAIGLVVEAEQHRSRTDVLVVGDGHFPHRACDLGRDGQLVRMHVGVVARDGASAAQIKNQTSQHQQHRAAEQKHASPDTSSRGRSGRRIELRGIASHAVTERARAAIASVDVAACAGSAPR